MWADLVKGLVSPITDLIANKQKQKLEKQRAEAAVDKIFAKASAGDAEIAGQIALVNTKNMGQTWKDEYALMVVTLPVVFGMISGVVEVAGVVPTGTTQQMMIAMFAPIEHMPEFWQNTFQVGILSALGVTVLKKLVA